MSNVAPPPGWYLDPSGADGLRWWDGRQWTPDVRPAVRPDGSRTSGGDPTPTPRRRGPAPWVWLLVGLLVAALLAGTAFAVGLFAPAAPSTSTASPVPTSTDSPDASSGPDATASPTDPTGSATPPDVPPSALAPGDCPAQPPATLPLASPNPLRVGDLGVPVPAGWGGPVQDTRVPRARDAWQYYVRSELGAGWASTMTVGFVQGTPDASPLADDAAAVLTCIVDGTMYSGTNAILAESDTTATTIGGTPAVRVDGTVAIDDPAIASAGSVVVLVVVDTSQGREFYFGTAPLEDVPQVQDVTAAADALTLG